MTAVRVLALVRDLFFRARLEAAAKAVSADVGYASSLDRARDQITETAPALVIVDLGDGAFDPEAIAKQTRELAAVQLVGFASHVELRKLGAAREAGFDLVLSREEFTARLPELLGGSFRK